MGVDIAELVEPLKRAVAAPGVDAYPDITDNGWVGYLEDAFWDAKIQAGLFSTFTIDENDEIVPLGDSVVDMTRDMQQIIVLYAAINVLTLQIQGTSSLFRAKAGPVEFETQSSATTQNSILKELQMRREMVIERLSDIAVTLDVVTDLLHMDPPYGSWEWTR